MSAFKGQIMLAKFELWAIESVKAKADKDGLIECPNCNGTGWVDVEVELPSGRVIHEDDECSWCDEGMVSIDDIRNECLINIASHQQYRLDCSESVRLLSSATKTDYFLNLCKAKEMHK